GRGDGARGGARAGGGEGDAPGEDGGGVRQPLPHPDAAASRPLLLGPGRAAGGFGGASRSVAVARRPAGGARGEGTARPLPGAGVVGRLVGRGGDVRKAARGAAARDRA